MTTLVHLFDTQEECQAAIDVINQGEHIPYDPPGGSESFDVPAQSGDKWYLTASSISVKYLGEPVEYEIVYGEN